MCVLNARACCTRLSAWLPDPDVDTLAVRLSCANGPGGLHALNAGPVLIENPLL
jgi:hypothetical protein